ncbi:MAG: WG repeat-containing protein [Bryobacteraceae bacterium]
MHLFSAVLCALAALVPFEKDGKWGYRDNGNVVISPRYELAREFSREGIAAVVDQEGWVYIDRTGRTVIRPLVVDNGPDYFREGLARFRRDGKVGFFDRRGSIAIQPAYTFAMPFSGGRAAVCEGCAEVENGEHREVAGGRWGYIDRTGRLVIPLEFSQAGNFEKGRARVRRGPDQLVIGMDGRPAKPGR